MPQSVATIDHQLAELTPQWETDQQNVDLTRRIARLWEDRFDQKQTEESLEGAYYYYHHLNELLGGINSATTGKVHDLQLQKLRLRARSIEDWLLHGGDHHEEAATYQAELQQLRAQITDLALKPKPTSKAKPTAPAANPFVALPEDRDAPPSAGPGIFGAN